MATHFAERQQQRRVPAQQCLNTTASGSSGADRQHRSHFPACGAHPPYANIRAPLPNFALLVWAALLLLGVSMQATRAVPDDDRRVAMASGTENTLAVTWRAAGASGR